MKKLLTILFILALPILAAAGVAVLGGGVSPPAGGDEEESCTGACVFVSSWTGTDILNSGTSYVWDAEDDAGGRLSHGTTQDTGWNDEDNYLHYSGTSSSISRVYENITATGTFGIRLAFNLVSESLGDGYYQRIVTASKLGVADLIWIELYQTSSTLYVRVRIYSSGSTWATVGSPIEISIGTWYQIQVKWQKNTGNGASFEVWNEAGSSQVGSTQTLSGYTTYNNDVDRVSVGTTYAASITTEHDIDIVNITNTYDFPGVRTP